ncbi:hypothetical protein CKM354_000804400 [Cercospora kikuchii]|uniref:Uncharacterized protein n=1 Tax=Cercospora kikuchii TaxID=84275 RepID=A0A9P3CLC0_9PEZI|nr:uncharacterized protein CKM354_000804400 [Cercospora kikuchii]GIZ44858.1 hypothetical protein CKM354_000804400 [Cercospora kikuchii]
MSSQDLPHRIKITHGKNTTAAESPKIETAKKLRTLPLIADVFSKMSTSTAEDKISSNTTITLASLNYSSGSNGNEKYTNDSSGDKDKLQPMYPPTVDGAAADTAWTAALYKSDWNAKGAKFLAEGK